MADSIGFLLDRTLTEFRNGSVSAAMTNLAVELTALLSSSTADEWQMICDQTRRHAIHSALLEDPYTKRAFDKPSGYAGDAVMLDFIYLNEPPHGTSELGKQIFQATTHHTNAISVLRRAERIADMIDTLSSREQTFSALSVGCGNMREITMTRALTASKVRSFLALDQDESCISFVSDNYAHLGISPQKLSVKNLIRKKTSIPPMDLIYASGIFDYLGNGIGGALCDILLDRLTIEGKLVIANYTPNNSGRAYMEAVMDWPLLYRNDSDLLKLLGTAASSSEFRVKLMHDEYDNIAYMEVYRKQ